MDKILGYLEVGTTVDGEVCINVPVYDHPPGERWQHFNFSPQQARAFAANILRHADEADHGIPKQPRMN